jgi:hypothetical protein
MRRYIVLLLITGIVWAQTDFDKLVLKNGTTYLGEYSKIEGDRLYFKHQDALAFQPVPVELIKQLQLKDGKVLDFGIIKKNSFVKSATLSDNVSGFGTLLLKSGTTYFGEYSKIEGDRLYFKHQDALAFQPVPVKSIRNLQSKDGQIIIDGGKVKISLTLEEYQKLSTEEKAIYDANLYNVKKWALYMPTSIITFGGFAGLHFLLTGKSEFWESLIFFGGSSAASLATPYFVFNMNEKFNFPQSILTDSEKEIYEQAYSKKLKQRKIKYAVGSICISVGVIGVIGAGSLSNADFSSSSGFGDYNGHTPW